MSEVRRVIVETDSLPPGIKTVQPTVRAWIQNDGTLKTDHLSAEFPTHGRVVCFSPSGWHLESNRCYVLDASRIEEPSGNCHWQASTMISRLPSVITAPSEVVSVWDIYKFCSEPVAKKFNLGEELLVETSMGELIGPFLVSADHKRLNPKTSVVKWWDRDSAEKISCRIGDFAFTRIQATRSYYFDPAEAVRKILRQIKESRDLSWLSKAKLTEISLEFSKFIELGESSWVKDDVQNFLRYLDTNTEVGASIIEAFKTLPAVQASLTAMRETALVDAKVAVESELSIRIEEVSKREIAVTDLESKVTDLRATAASLEKQVGSFEEKILARRKEAEAAFNDELTLLAARPASVAALASLFPLGRMGSSEPPKCNIKATAKVTRSGGKGLKEALKSHFLTTGVSMKCAHFVADAVAAALSAGQPVTFVGAIRDIFASAALAALNYDTLLQIDTRESL